MEFLRACNHDMELRLCIMWISIVYLIVLKKIGKPLMNKSERRLSTIYLVTGLRMT